MTSDQSIGALPLSLKDIIRGLVPMTDDEFDFFRMHLVRKIFNKNATLLRPDQGQGSLFIICSGLVRGYRIVRSEEVTHHFYRAGWFATDYYSYLTDQPGDLYLQALVDTVAYKFSRRTFEKLYTDNQKFETLGRILAEQSFLIMSRRARQFQTDNLTRRYLDLVGKNPALFERVPQKYIASYLGVAPQSLSRMKASLNHH